MTKRLLVGLLAVITAFLLGIPPLFFHSSSTNYYVDGVLGNDAYPGTSPTRPWKTIAKVNATTLLPGTQVLLRGGQVFYEELFMSYSGTEDAPITFTSYGSGGRATIDGDDGVTKREYCININQKSHLRFINLILKDADQPTGTSGDNIGNAWGSANLYFENIDSGFAEAFNAGLFNQDGLIVRNCRFHDAELGYGLYSSAKVGATRPFIISDSEFDNNAGHGIKFNAGVNARYPSPHIYNNYIHDNGIAGVSDWASEDALYEFNRVIDNEYYGIDLGFDGAVPAWGALNATIRNNTIRQDPLVNRTGDGYNPCIQIRNNTSGHTIEDNILTIVGSIGKYLTIYSGGSAASIDYNNYYGGPTDKFIEGYVYATPGSGTYYQTLAAWVAGTVYDDNSIDSDPSLSASYIPPNGNAACASSSTSSYAGYAYCMPPSESAAFFSEDFEDGTSPFWATSEGYCDALSKIAIVTSAACYGGAGKCMRGNLYNGVTDPVLGFVSTSNPHANLGGGSAFVYYCNGSAAFDLESLYSTEIWISFKWKWDTGIGLPTRNNGIKTCWVGDQSDHLYFNQWSPSIQIYGAPAYITANFYDQGGGAFAFPQDGLWHDYLQQFDLAADQYRFWVDGTASSYNPVTYTGPKFSRITFGQAHTFASYEESLGWYLDEIHLYDHDPR